MSRMPSLIIPVFLLCCTAQDAAAPPENGGEAGKAKLLVSSPAFEASAPIPSKHTCEGEDVSPTLSLQGVPEGTQSLAVICDDPDAPMGTWVHWVLYNLPPDTKELKEGIPREKRLEGGGLQGKNDFGKIGYGGPCPPRGKPHRYFFKVYALDTTLELAPGAKKQEVLEKTREHILATGELVGIYAR